MTNRLYDLMRDQLAEDPGLFAAMPPLRPVERLPLIGRNLYRRRLDREGFRVEDLTVRVALFSNEEEATQHTEGET